MPRTLEQGFDTFLGWLEPSATEHDKAASHKGSVKSCMVNNFECFSFFETGSFGHGTGVRHYSDTDYFAACPSEKFYDDSTYTLRKVKEALQETFWQTENIEVKTPAVRIPFGKWASENLELTPCTFNGIVTTPVGQKASYDIPDYDGGWMQSSPAAHNAWVDQIDKKLDYKLKPLIKFIKAWKFYQNVPISSFYLELRTAKYAAEESTIVYDIDIKRVIAILNDYQLARIQDPMGISGYVSPCKTQARKEDALSKLSTALSRAEKAVAKRESNVDDAFYWWNLFFAEQFPSR